MVRLSFFLFGYREIEIPSDDTPRLVSLFLKLGVNSYQKGSLYLIYSSDFTRIRAYLEKMNAKISAPLGFPRLFGFLRRRIIAVFALVFSIFFNPDSMDLLTAILLTPSMRPIFVILIF